MVRSPWRCRLGHASFPEPGMEDSYALERLQRVSKKFVIVMCLLICGSIVRFMQPGQCAGCPGQPAHVRPPFSIATPIYIFVVCLCAFSFLLARRMHPLAVARHYDVIAFAVVYVIVLPVRISTVDNMLQDEAWVMWTGIVGALMFSVFLELKWYFFALHLHLSSAYVCALAAGVMGGGLGMAGRWQLVLANHLVFLALIAHSFTSEGDRRALFLSDASLKAQMERSKEFAHAERAVALKAAEQASLLSFVRSVFDIFGSLVWHAADSFAEPRLHFAAAKNPALDELLQCSAAMEPLDIILGPMPAAPGKDREQWQQDRQRLWNYVELEASEHTGRIAADASQLQGWGMARKIPVTCRTPGGQAETIEVFIHRSTDSGVLFGILRDRSERLPPPPDVEAQPPSLPASGQRGFAAGSRAGSAASSMSSADDLWPVVAAEGADVSCVVNAAAPGLPFLRCSAEYLTLLAGPVPFVLHQKSADWLLRGMRDGVALVAARPDERPLPGGKGKVLLCIMHRERWRIDLRASCTFVFGPIEASGAIPVSITFTKFKPPEMKRMKGRGGRADSHLPSVLSAGPLVRGLSRMVESL